MVIGLDTFAAHFAAYQEHYVLIGGAAAWLILDEAGIDPRATKDLDIVLCLEALDREFVSVFWDFIRAGGYQIQEKSSGAKNFYRFQRPSRQGYPIMLELFSRKPDVLTIPDGSRLTPIPVEEDVSSLSAILLDEGYYDFIHRHKRELGGVSIVDEECLIPLKARAWLDLTQRKAAGEDVDSRNIKKHRNDVLRLYQVVNPGHRLELPGTIRRDLAAFLKAVEPDLDQHHLRQLGIQGISVAEIFQTLRAVYGLTKG
ncbi:MAG TPA: hypothetical protein P5244_08670 [Syntrophales bacterium]|mgnify:CR=1 FL=1|jgi:hypothetical protein|nr:hypothetical protein [Deltaproteobacteria bacterium]HRR41289.1 hypothetical protein [Syntrophales bacterium]